MLAAFQISIDNLLLHWVLREPALAVTQQLVHLCLADPVVLIVVEYGNEDIQVAQQFVQPANSTQSDGVVRARSPVGEGIVKRVTYHCHRVAEWLEQAAQKKGRFSNWSQMKLAGENFSKLGELVAWRATLWEGDRLLAEQKSFLW